MSEKRYDDEKQGIDPILEEWKNKGQEVSTKRADKHRAAGRMESFLSRFSRRGKEEQRKSAANNEALHSAYAESIEVEEEEHPRKKAPLWARSLFWIVRKSIAPLIMIVMLLIGLYIGYVIMGDQPKEEVFQFSTYKHLWDLIFSES